MNHRKRQNVRYWNDFCDELRSRGSQLQFPKYRKSHYIEFRIEKKCGVMVRQVIKPKPGAISAVFYIRGPNAITFFDALKEQQVEIDKEFGESLKWWGEVHRGEQRLGLIKSDINPADETDWPNQHEWLATKLENFNKVFRPRIVALNAGDLQPPEGISTEEESFVEEMEALQEQLTREFAETRDVLKSVVEEIRGVREDLKIIRRLLGDRGV
ncbi:MAG: DUF4268 domain-containing protein [Candidatus Poribacteria bacterium]|nr:DUF4268 domain-containing protein [Candidatus Poribacteria bacterium]